jgi:hypothetical protein
MVPSEVLCDGTRSHLLPSQLSLELRAINRHIKKAWAIPGVTEYVMHALISIAYCRTLANGDIRKSVQEGPSLLSVETL